LSRPLHRRDPVVPDRGGAHPNLDAEHEVAVQVSHPFEKIDITEFSSAGRFYPDPAIGSIAMAS
jgi:hypothetical protein